MDIPGTDRTIDNQEYNIFTLYLTQLRSNRLFVLKCYNLSPTIHVNNCTEKQIDDIEFPEDPTRSR